MNVSALLRALATLVIVTCLVTGQAGSAAAVAPHTTCSRAVDRPHISQGAGGAIVKAKINCSASGVNAKIEAMLYLCSKKPQKTEAWVNDNCKLKGYGVEYYTPVPAGKTKAAYAPQDGVNGAHGSGYWVGCAAYVLTDTSGQYEYVVFGPVWPGSG
jgi:hypothetical protein